MNTALIIGGMTSILLQVSLNSLWYTMAQKITRYLGGCPRTRIFQKLKF